MSLTAHDVRNMVPCVVCKDLLLMRDSIHMAWGGYMHGRCYIEKNGLDRLLELPMEQLMELRLSDIGHEAMKAILDKKHKPLTRAELLRALQSKHGQHNGFFQGGNFLDCRRCRLHVMFRDTLTWKPPRARKERSIMTLEDVAGTVRE